MRSHERVFSRVVGQFADGVCKRASKRRSERRNRRRSLAFIRATMLVFAVVIVWATVAGEWRAFLVYGRPHAAFALRCKRQADAACRRLPILLTNIDDHSCKSTVFSCYNLSSVSQNFELQFWRENYVCAPSKRAFEGDKQLLIDGNSWLRRRVADHKPIFGIKTGVLPTVCSPWLLAAFASSTLTSEQFARHAAADSKRFSLPLHLDDARWPSERAARSPRVLKRLAVFCSRVEEEAKAAALAARRVAFVASCKRLLRLHTGRRASRHSRARHTEPKVANGTKASAATSQKSGENEYIVSKNCLLQTPTRCRALRDRATDGSRAQKPRTTCAGDEARRQRRRRWRRRRRRLRTASRYFTRQVENARAPAHAEQKRVTRKQR